MKKIFFFLMLLGVINAYADLSTDVKKSATCAACHGPTGISTNPAWPHLAGQHASYLAKQLRDFNHHGRESAIMTPLVTNLSTHDLMELALFYANQPLPEGNTPPQYVARGEQLYRGGDLNQHITACIACHGPKGTGNAEAGFPVLSGQNPGYTLSQLRAFKEGSRRNDLNHIMRDISSRMNEDDMQAVAYYTAGLH